MNIVTKIFIFFFLTTNVFSEENKYNVINKSKNIIQSFEKKKYKEVNLENLAKLGSISYPNLPSKMVKTVFKDCKQNKNFKCEKMKAGKEVSETFKKKGGFSEKHPGKLIQAMAYYEILFLSLYSEKEKNITRLKEKFDQIYVYKTNDLESAKSLIKMNKGREKMRKALGMTLDTSTETAIQNFWTLGEFLEMGEPIELEKLDKNLKKRKKLLQKYKAALNRLSEKLEEKQDESKN